MGSTTTIDVVENILKKMSIFQIRDSIAVIPLEDDESAAVHIGYISNTLRCGEAVPTLISFVLNPTKSISRDLFINVHEQYRTKGVARELLSAHKTICSALRINKSTFPASQNQAPEFWMHQGYRREGEYYVKEL